MKAILSLGSNSNQQENIMMAEARLMGLFSVIDISIDQWTEPVGVKQKAKFLNEVAMGDTPLSYEELRQQLKDIEREAGRTPELTQKGIIPLDIDILQYGDKRFKPADWQREYIRTALSQLGL